jgi:hypothetical protein
MNLTSQIQLLKTELREFIALSETITPGEYKVTRPRRGRTIIVAEHGKPICDFWNRNEESVTNATFIARSRNISPAMAKMLLATVETLDDMPHNVADALELKLLKLWEETK